MENIENSGSAFPVIHTDAIGDGNGGTMPGTYSHGGITMRDYFAAKALQGILANQDCEFWEVEAEFAAMAYGHADAMIQARKGGAA